MTRQPENFRRRRTRSSSFFCNLHAVALVLAFLCSCASRQHEQPAPLPPEVLLNKYAGHGDLVMVNLRIWGEDFPFFVDTGTPVTVFDKSLAARLGPRLGSVPAQNFGRNATLDVYKSPEIFLGGIRLKAGQNCYTYDFRQKSLEQAHPIMGILGMDCLKNYCIQLDFDAKAMSFLPSGHVDAAKFDRSLPIEYLFDLPQIQDGSFIGSCRALIDTGWIGKDGGLNPELFKRAGDVKSSDEGEVRIAKIIWNGRNYNDVTVDEVTASNAPSQNIVGLEFLARHRLVFDFPARKLYLKQTSVGPVPNLTLASLIESLNAGRLPGIAQNANGRLDCTVIGAGFIIIDLHNDNDPAVDHYKVVRKTLESPWGLQEHWRTDQNNHKIEEHSAPHHQATK